LHRGDTPFQQHLTWAANATLVTDFGELARGSHLWLIASPARGHPGNRSSARGPQGASRHATTV